MFSRRFAYILISLFVAGVASAQENLSDLENKSAPVLNNELRKINDDIREIDSIISGTVIQVVNTMVSAVATGSTALAQDDSVPQISEGDQYMSLAITPKSSTNKLKIDVVFYCAANANAAIIVALFQDSTANAIAAVTQMEKTSGDTNVICFSHYMTAGTTSSTTFKVRAGCGGNTITFNGTAGARLMGGVAASSITVTEIAA